MRIFTIGLLAATSVFLIGAPLYADDAFIYVKKETREATRQATLEANGAAGFTGNSWYLIGPFANGGLAKPWPPEKEIDLEAHYPGKGEEVAWKKTDFPDGRVNDLRKHFKQSNQCVCYLYRRIESPAARRVTISLGSDDGIEAWFNGKQVLFRDAIRACEADQDLVDIDLHAGRNDLLLKINNIAGDWAFYFAPTVARTALLRLERRLDADFPPTTGEAAFYRIETLPLPPNEAIEGGGVTFRPDGKMYVATRRGDVWLVANPTSENPDEVKWSPYVRGLHEILGLCNVDKDLYLVQRPEITLVRDLKGAGTADEFTTICDKFGLSGDYHEFIFGPARDKDGNLFITLNVGFGGGHQSKVPYRGFCMKITPKGEMIPWAYGLRSPNGINFAPDGRLYYCDNQGEWVPACKLQEIRQGDFYGHMASVRWWPGKKDGDQPPMVQPAIWFPYDEMSRSATEPVWDTTGGKFGPFAGQCIVGELTESLLMRCNLEEVKGRMQGCVFLFRQGFQCGPNRLAFAPDGSLAVAETNRGWGSVGGQPFGVQRVVFTGRTPFEIHSMCITPDGWDLHFTLPVDRAKAAAAATYFLESYTYHHWATYGSPEIDKKQNAITAIRVSEDGKTVSLTVPVRTKEHLFHLQLKGLTTADGTQPLLHADAYYTLNETP